MDYKYKVMDYKKVMSLKDIYLVLDDEDTEKMYLESFMHACKMTPRAVSDVENLKSLIMTGGPKKEENCCICMDELTNPKLLKSVGTYFPHSVSNSILNTNQLVLAVGRFMGK